MSLSGKEQSPAAVPAIDWYSCCKAICRKAVCVAWLCRLPFSFSWWLLSPKSAIDPAQGRGLPLTVMTRLSRLPEQRPAYLPYLSHVCAAHAYIHAFRAPAAMPLVSARCLIWLMWRACLRFCSPHLPPEGGASYMPRAQGSPPHRRI